MTAEKTLPKRNEVPKDLTWDLATVYKTDADWEKDFKRVSDMIPKLAAFKGKLTKTGKNLLDALTMRDQVGQIMGKLYVYSNMRLHEDTTNPTYQALSMRAATLNSDLSAALSYMTPELLATDATRLQGLLKRYKGLRPYQHEFDELDRSRPHVLSTEMEHLLAQVGEIASAPDRIFEMLNNADLKLPRILAGDGREVQLTHGNYASVCLESQDRVLRKNAFEGMHGTFNGLRNTLAACYASQVKQGIFYARARKYPSAVEAATSSINVPVSVYTNLIGTVGKNLPKLHRYLELRKKMLGLSDLRIYDLYTPMVKEVDYSVKYDEAKEQCLKALAPLGKEYVDVLRGGFNSRWIDVMENQNKRSGAYSWGSYGTNPFMLLNWSDSMDSMFTLIHEAGHSMHSFFTRKSQPYHYGSYTLFVAEVASICNEMLLTHYLLKNTEDRALKQYIINHAMDGFRGTLFRQTLFAEFEMEVHNRAEAGEAVTPEMLCSIYKGLNQKYYGAVVTLDDLIEVEWARIPHFYSSFYVYQYATGISAATALAKQIIAEGEPAVKRYLRFLSTGNSDYSLNMLRDAGVDLSTPAPIQQALDVFEGYVDQFEKLMPVKASV
ncbi:MAG: oligoendopeptidase F [Candidatus Obscuribacterales bacterium]|nr:oligoendopeptidase F [Candidatus Obscuribacterales bacterium]